MRIINDTHWRTDHLRAFATEAAKRILDPEHRKDMTVHFVYGRRSYAISGYAYHGKVAYRKTYGYYVKIKVPSGNTRRMKTFTKVYNDEGQWSWVRSQCECPTSKQATCGHDKVKSPVVHDAIWTANSKATLASVLVHEYGHTFGLQHTREKNCMMSAHTNAGEIERAAWAAALPLEKVAPKAKAPVDLDARRQTALAKTEALVAKWEKAEARAAKFAVKYRRRLAAQQRYQTKAAIRG